MKNLTQTITDAGIDPVKWQDAIDAKGDFTDYCLASDVAEALDLETLFVSVGLTDAEKDNALETARTRWPSL